MSDMIADSVDFTLKKSQNNGLVLSALAVLPVLLIDLAGQHYFDIATGAVVIASHGILLFLVITVFKNSKSRSSEIKKLQERERSLSAELDAIRKRCEVQSECLEKFGRVFLSESRRIYESVGLIQSMREAGIEDDVPGFTEKNLRDSAEKIRDCSRDIVTLFQLEKGRIFAIEQEIDPVELVRCCISEVEKKHPNMGAIDFAEKPDCKLVLTGDLVKLKELLIKLMSRSLGQGEDSRAMGGGVVVRLAYRESTGLTFTVKLIGYHLSTSQFQRLCSPMEKYKTGTKVDLGLAIAKHLAKLHGSALEVMAKSTTGSVLSFCVPDDRVRVVGSADRIEVFDEIAIY